MSEHPTRPLVTFSAAAATPSQFTVFWKRYYNVAGDKPYEAHIRRDHASGPYTAEAALALFGWKIGKRFEKSSRPAVERNFILRREEAHALPSDITAGEFLKVFRDGGVIWRIFWLHCCYLDRFPIYDQHVHRAMTFIEEGKRDELVQRPDKKKVDLYLTRYLPFHRQFDGIDGREADRALWVCGKFLKKWQFPPMGQPGESS